MKTVLVIILISFLISCQPKTEKLFWINENTENNSDFLFIAESTNILPISADSVRKFLNWEEVEETRYLESQIFTKDSLLPQPVIFKNFGELFTSNKFKLFVLFRDANDTLGRDYKFILRTFTPDWEIIDSYELATWNESKGNFCFGSINKNLIIERNCDNSEYPDILQITKDGQIIMTSFHQP